METEGIKQVESKDEYGNDSKGVVKEYVAEIKLYEQKFKEWNQNGIDLIKEYRREANVGKSDNGFNILWANTETLKPAIFSQTPKADIRRRFADRDPVARFASELWERATEIQLENSNFRSVAQEVRDDYLLPGRGTFWVRYEHDEEQVPVRQPVRPDLELGSYVDLEGNPISEDETPVMQDEEGLYIEVIESRVTDERAVVDYVSFRDFGHSVAKRWEEVTKVWKRVEMTREQLVEKFGEDKAKQIKLTNSRRGSAAIANQDEEQNDGIAKTASIYEVWNKETKTICWISKDYDKAPLEMKDDFLGLKGFFPCPKPIYSITTTGSLIPRPFYAMYQTLAEELNSVVARKRSVLDAIKVVGLSSPEMATAFKTMFTKDNELVSFDGFRTFIEKGGFDGAAAMWPLEEHVKAYISLSQAEDQLKEKIYEVTGISDIVRGSTSPSETATAQQMKGHYQSLRVRPLQDEFQRISRDVIRIIAEIVAEQFSLETIAVMTGAKSIAPKTPIIDPRTKQPVPPEVAAQMVTEKAIELLKNEGLRDFAIDIESDSTVALDENEEKQKRTELMKVLSQFLKEYAQASQAMPEMAKPMASALLYVLRAFKQGRNVEAEFEEAIEVLNQKAEQRKKQPPQPNPEQVKQQGDQQMKMRELELKNKELELKQFEIQQKAATDREKIASDFQAKLIESEKRFEARMAEILTKKDTDALKMIVDQQPDYAQGLT